MPYGKMIKNKTRLTLKLFIMAWFVLLFQIFLKLTFDYWQPYAIPNQQLEMFSNFIDIHIWLKFIIDGFLYIINGILIMLCSVRQWKFKRKLDYLFSIIVFSISYILSIFWKQSSIITIIITFALPLIIVRDRNKLLNTFLFTILTFILSNIFLWLSLKLENFSNVDNMDYVVKIFFQLDYYIMLILNYILFNLLRKERVVNGT